MSQYRDDLEAARLRADTLEAKVKERDAALAARDAELLERDAEVARLRGALGLGAEPSREPGRRTPWPVLVMGSAMLVAVAGSFTLARSPCALRDARPLRVVSDFDGADPGPSVPAPELVPIAPTEIDAEPGPSTAAEAHAIVLEASRAVKTCYELELATRPGLAGRIDATLHVDSAGDVTRVELGASPMRTAAFDACVTRALSAPTFPVPETGGATAVQVPLVFRPAGGAD